MIDSMNAVRAHTWGAPEVLTFELAPRPEPAAGEVLIRVHAASINPVDCKTRSGGGFAKRLGEEPFPVILGWDVAGVVDRLGPEAHGFSVGDRVYGCIHFPNLGNAYAEYATAPVEHLAHIPEGLDMAEAAALPLAVLTAWQALDAIDLQPGQRTVVVGAAGGVGHLAVQLAKRRGAEVVGVAGPRNQAFILELGADEAVDYSTGDLATLVGEADVIFDAVGRGTVATLSSIVNPGGSIVSIVGGVKPDDLPEGIIGKNIMIRPSGEQLVQVSEMVAARRLRPVVQEVILATEAARAHSLSDAGHVRGKLVLDLSQ